MTRSISTTSGSSRSTASHRLLAVGGLADDLHVRPAARGTRAAPRARPRGRRRRRTRIGSPQRHLQDDGGARARARLDAQPPAQRPGALLHRGQAEPARAQPGLVGVEADAVVGDRQRAARPSLARAAGRRRGWRRRGAGRSAAPPGRSGRPRRALGARLARRRRARARPSRRARAAAPRRACAALSPGPRSRAVGGRSSKISERSSSIASRASSLQARAAAPWPPRGRGRAASPRPRRSARARTASALTESCSSRARRLRSSTIDQLAAALVELGVLDGERRVRREHLDQLLVGLVEVLGADLVGQVERAHDAARRATIGTPRNERISGCAAGHQPRKRGSRLMSACGTAPGDSSIAPAARGCAAAGPWRAIELVAHARGDERAKAPSPSGTPSAA